MTPSTPPSIAICGNCLHWIPWNDHARCVTGTCGMLKIVPVGNLHPRTKPSRRQDGADRVSTERGFGCVLFKGKGGE